MTVTRVPGSVLEVACNGFDDAIDHFRRHPCEAGSRIARLRVENPLGVSPEGTE